MRGRTLRRNFVFFFDFVETQIVPPQSGNRGNQNPFGWPVFIDGPGKWAAREIRDRRTSSQGYPGPAN